MRLPRPASTTGFTLIELLIVVAVILILVSILIPVIGMVRRQAKEVLCRNNFGQLGLGITAYRTDNDNRLPTSLSTMFLTGQSMANENAKILICPLDPTKGGPGMNREVLGLTDNHETGCSFLFEANNDPAKWTYSEDHQDSGWPFSEDWYQNADPKPRTWADAKILQLKQGNIVNGVKNKPFRPSDMPILRCYWHQTWKPGAANDEVKKVLNLAWDMSVFWSIPYWEHQANPDAFPFHH